MRDLVKTSGVCALLIISCCLLTQVISSQPAEKSLLLTAMEEELQRSMKGLSDTGNLPPYFISYQITESIQYSAAASFGATRYSANGHSRLFLLIF